ncbi:aminotransferase class I/II-fold pyridoxal phosphate-dependent enzyme [Candidatus Poribacteria bacterium]|nr:aminotransferase class I/II-fold pyridoxal phosphate-dependent enzyme [Candidatus Poribacteria bacterium]
MIPTSKPSTGKEELSAIEAVMETGWLGMGSVTKDFEAALEEYIGAKNIIAVNTGTSALHIALDGYGIGHGHEVIVPSLTYAASIQAIISTGATPVFCDVNEKDLLVDIKDIKRRITSKTKAIMPVHYCGKPCDMDSLMALAEEHNLVIIEDAAHAFGSKYKGRKIGSFGHATCFSFDPIKIITCGEGGAVALDDDEVAEKIRQKRILGIDKETWRRYRNERGWFYEVVSHGFRYHMSNINAAIGLEQMKKVDKFITRRREICRRYDTAFQSTDGIYTLDIDYSETAPFTYIIRVPGMRDDMMDFLKEKEVGSGVHYIANHTQPFFRQYTRGELNVTDRLWKEILTLPLYSEMTNEEADQVIHAVTNYIITASLTHV